MILRLQTLAALGALVAIGCGGGGTPVREVAWPRFPADPSTRVEPNLAVLYATDNIGPTSTLARLGYPDRMLFLLHHDHPRLHVVVTSCPASRYSGGRPLSESVEATSAWKTLALDPAFEWIDLAGLGYNHSPPGDARLDHHEFSVRQTGCNIDHRVLGAIDYCRRQMNLAREAYRAAGIPDERVVMLRFPGGERSPNALQAAKEAGFRAVLDTSADDRPGAESWEPLPDGGEILIVGGASVMRRFAVAEDLEQGLATGRIDPSAVTSSVEFQAALARGADLAAGVENAGGLLLLYDRWSETFREIGGARPRYLLVDALLDGIETRYGHAVWYPTSRDLVTWLEARRHAKLAFAAGPRDALVTIEPPEDWRRGAAVGLDNASVIVTAPGGAGRRVVQVLMQESDREWVILDPARWWSRADQTVITFPLRGIVRLRLSTE